MTVLFTRPYKSRVYGTRRILERFIDLITDKKFLKGKFYLPWLELEEKEKRKFLGRLSFIIKSEILGKDFKKALAKDILQDGSIHTETYMYQYVKSRVYGGSLIAMLSDLQDALKGK